MDERDASQPESSTAADLLGKGNQKAKRDPIMEKKQVQSSLKGFFTSLPMKRPLEPSMTVSAVKPKQPKVLSLSRPVTIASFLKAPQPSNSKTSGSVKAKTRSMTQMHLTHLPLLHTCPTCGMSFVRGGPDEGVHVTHHTRVLRGILWEGMKKGEGEGWKVVQEDVEFGGKRRGRIIVVDGSFGGSKASRFNVTNCVYLTKFCSLWRFYPLSTVSSQPLLSLLQSSIGVKSSSSSLILLPPLHPHRNA